MLERVISGGQTGVDEVALRAAAAAGIPTGGTAPNGWATEDGPAPWLADFGLVKCDESGYPPRTIANARDSDGTLWIGDLSSPGGRLTTGMAEALGKPLLIVQAGAKLPGAVRDWLPGLYEAIRLAGDVAPTAADVGRWIVEEGIRTLNVAGNRESTEPGIGARAEAFFLALFRLAQSV